MHTAPTSGDDMIHRTRRGPVVDRVPFLLERCRDRRVIHLGFVDTGLAALKRDDSTWLHSRLASSARELVGLDLDAAGVADAEAAGFEAYEADCQSSDSLRGLGIAPGEVVLAGELIEHLERPGDFLDAVHEIVAPDGRLILTTPNAFSLLNVVASLAQREIVNPDHVSWYSATTLETLLGRHAWHVDSIAYYTLTKLGRRAGASPALRIRRGLFSMLRMASRPVLAAAPTLSHGLIVEASPAR